MRSSTSCDCVRNRLAAASTMRMWSLPRWRAALPVRASRRRTPAATPASATIEIRPISPVRRTWVPPQSSTDQPRPLPVGSPIDTTRTSSPYFSPNRARAPEFFASSTLIRRVSTGVFCSTISLAMSSISDQFLRGDRLGVDEVEAQPVGRHQRAALRHVIAQHQAQRLVQQVRRRVVGSGWPNGAHGQRRGRAACPSLSVPCSTFTL